MNRKIGELSKVLIIEGCANSKNRISTSTVYYVMYSSIKPIKSFTYKGILGIMVKKANNKCFII